MSASDSTLKPIATQHRYKLVFFVPPDNREEVQDAIFATGAGRYPGAGQYTNVAFATLGTGQFRPGSTSKPHIGEPGKLEVLQEYRVEIMCPDEVIRDAVAALKRTHPYEEVAYEVYRIEDF